MQHLQRKQLDHFGAYSGFDGLGLLQLSLFQYKHLDWEDRNGLVVLPPTFLLPEGYKHLRIPKYATSDYLGHYAIKQNPPQLSIFHDEFWNARIRSQPWNTNFWLQEKERSRREALNNALNEFDLVKALSDAVTAALGNRNENFIKAKPELYNEVSEYFKVNDFSQVSMDCINYLLNQYHDGNDFAANSNLYVSANTPLYQNSQNPSRALEWKPGTQAVNEGFTNFGNVLSALFENYPNPAYEGYIIRNMFGINGLNVSASIRNEWLGSSFYFKNNLGSSVAIHFNDNNGLDILNQGSNTNAYITNLVDQLSSRLSGLNTEGKRFLFLKPKRIENVNKFISGNNTTSGRNFIKQSLQILGSNLSEEGKLQQFEIAYDAFDPLLPPSLQQNDYEAKIRESARYFKLYGNPEFGEYLESLLPLDPTFSQDDYYALYVTVRAKTKDLVWDYFRAIFDVVVESFEPVIELALLEVGGGLALKILRKLPLRYISNPIRNVINRLLASSSQAFSNFKHAKKYGIKTYSELGKVFSDLGITRALEKVQFHHLIEQRFVNNTAIKNWLGSSTNNWKSIVLTRAEHQVFTNGWRQRIGYGNVNGSFGVNTSTATLLDIQRAAREIYKDYPEILRALGL
ncbi:hypothetical protein [Jejuia pallidilutea]|uniref:Uncharacterized protein n=1 Tax=Jejuia pallidilutea TaxID=504487 RepID=A0A090VWS8_9FLAO|nr:hypothetical protein [Jejuia pallidilutea]GAL67724.1 hypothetical protein JCM19301_1011 [Jejuia pallidilutea]GAL71980.1 hypothetical protein JCM19302_325 [Jejuia pallidilutea]